MQEGHIAAGFDLGGQVALVTGASRGIGQAIALALGKAGATVIGTATSESGAKAIGDYLAAANVKGSGMKLNVTDAAEVDTVIAAIEKDVGTIGILVNNAGITRDAVLHRMAKHQWSEVIKTNLDSVFNMSRLVIDGMRARSFGRIISISSINGRKGQFGQANYAAAKAGLLGFTKAVALEGAAKGITCNVIAPGYINTEMVAAVPKDVLETKILPLIPVGRLGTADEIARCVTFLAADDAGFITGACIDANGGQYMGA